MTNESLLNEFYTSFKNRDYEGMNQCYHPQVKFSDPVFPKLEGSELKAMWHMLVSRGKDTIITFHVTEVDAGKGICHWEAIYSFGEKKRRVHNVVTSWFEFQDGLIIRQIDSFDLWKWLIMAFGPVGLIFGWSGFLKKKVQNTADQNLRNFIKSNSKYSS